MKLWYGINDLDDVILLSIGFGSIFVLLIILGKVCYEYFNPRL